MAGRPPDVGDKDILRVFFNSDDPALFTGEVADDLPIKRNGALKRLHELADDGYLETKRRGQSRIWWLTDEGRKLLDREADLGQTEEGEK